MPFFRDDMTANVAPVFVFGPPRPPRTVEAGFRLVYIVHGFYMI